MGKGEIAHKKMFCFSQSGNCIPICPYLYLLLNLKSLKLAYQVKGYGDSDCLFVGKQVRNDTSIKIKPFTKQWNFTLVQIKSICRWQNKCDSKIDFFVGVVENMLGKGENAGYQHFLLFPKYFQKPSTFGRDFFLSGKVLTFYQTVLNVDGPDEERFWKHCWKRLNCW